MIPVYLLLLLPGDVLGLAGVGDSTTPEVDGELAFVFSMRGSVAGALSVRGSVAGDVGMRGGVAGQFSVGSN